MRPALTTLLPAASIALLLGLTGCTSGADAGSGSSGGATVAEGEDIELTFIQGVIGDNFYISMECGVRAAAEEIGGVDVTVQGPQKFDASLQQPILQSVVATDPNAILIAPNDVTALQRPLQDASENAEVVLVDTTVEDPSFAVSEIASDNVGGGAAAFEAVQGLVPDGGQVLVIDNAPGISTSDARVQGFADAAAEDSSFEYVGVQYAMNQPSTAAQIVTSTLQRYPDLKAIFATNLFSAEGAATGIEQAGKAGQVQVVGFDAGPSQVEALRDGTVQAVIAQQPYDIGYQGVEQAVAAIKGEPTEKKIQTGFSIITADTLDTEEGQAALYATEC
jgi:ribose transport system substrate-binding protein